MTVLNQLLKPLAFSIVLGISAPAFSEPPSEDPNFPFVKENTGDDDALISALGALLLMDEETLRQWDPTDETDALSVFMSSSVSEEKKPSEDSQLYQYFKGENAEPLPKLTPLQVGAPQEQKPILDLSQPPEDTSKSSSAIFDKLSGIAEEEKEEAVQLRPPALLIEKPVSGSGTMIELKEKPAAPETPALSIKPITLPENVGVKPVETPPRATASDILKATGKDKIYGPAPCVWTSVGKRNLLGKSDVEFTNNCGRDVEVGVRFCETGKADRQNVISIAANGHARRSVSHTKDGAPRYEYLFCIEKGCAPELPASCGE